MLSLESQVCSLDLANRLRELGVKQESLFYYAIGNHLKLNDSLIFAPGKFTETTVMLRDYYSAYTASELLEMLPKSCYEIINSIRWVDVTSEFYEISFKKDNLCDALAKMLIHLIEQGIVKP
jgi:hypothetical protein